MIPKRTEREFDSRYNEWDKWPMELTYRVYSDLIDDINQELNRRDNEEASTDPSSSDDD